MCTLRMFKHCTPALLRMETLWEPAADSLLATPSWTQRHMSLRIRQARTTWQWTLFLVTKLALSKGCESQTQFISSLQSQYNYCDRRPGQVHRASGGENAVNDDAVVMHIFYFLFCFSAKCGYAQLSAHIHGSKLSNVQHFSSRMYSYMIAGKSCLNGSLLIHSRYEQLVPQVGLILKKLQVPFIHFGGSYFQCGVP